MSPCLRWRAFALLSMTMLGACASHVAPVQREAVGAQVVALGGVEITLVPPPGMVSLRDIEGAEARAAERQLEEEMVPNERLLAVFALPQLTRGGTAATIALVTIDREMETAEVSAEHFERVKEGMIVALRTGAVANAPRLPVYRLSENAPRSIQVVGLMPLSTDEVTVAAMSVALVRKRVLGLAIFSTARSAADLARLQHGHAQWVRELLRRNPDLEAALAPAWNPAPGPSRAAVTPMPGSARPGKEWPENGATALHRREQWSSTPYRSASSFSGES